MHKFGIALLFLTFVAFSISCVGPSEDRIRLIIQEEVSSALMDVRQGLPGLKGEEGPQGSPGELGSVVSAERFELVDSAGNVVAVLGIGVDSFLSGPGLVFLNTEGTQLVSIATGPAGSSWIQLSGADGRPRGYFSYLPTQGRGASISLYSATGGTPVTELYISDDGGFAALSMEATGFNSHAGIWMESGYSPSILLEDRGTGQELELVPSP